MKIIGNWPSTYKVGPCPMKARSDYSDAVRTIRDLREKDDQKADPPILPSQQTRQRPGWEKPVAMEFMFFTGFVFGQN